MTLHYVDSCGVVVIEETFLGEKCCEMLTKKYGHVSNPGGQWGSHEFG